MVLYIYGDRVIKLYCSRKLKIAQLVGKLLSSLHALNLLQSSYLNHCNSIQCSYTYTINVITFESFTILCLGQCSCAELFSGLLNNIYLRQQSIQWMLKSLLYCTISLGCYTYIDDYNILIFQYSKYIHFLLYVQRMFL